MALSDAGSPPALAGVSGNSLAEPIAIIGIGCRFPGASGPEEFWRLLRDGVDAIREVPADRFDIDAVYDPRPGTPGKLSTRWGGFLDQIDRFDPYFFGISPREASRMDPQQRLLLEVAWEALEDAGLVAEELAGTRAAVFVGACNSDYTKLVDDPAEIDIYFAGGVAQSVLSGRLSYALGLQGPSVAVDTACSTSLVAVHLACQSLRSGESALALAGGVNAILLPLAGMSFSRAGMLAPDGRCKFGDARADGFVRSEGAGVVVLKPVSRALADGDPIYAVILGSAVNNDGRSGGLLMTPSVPGQEAVFREAYRNAGVAPARVHYVEMHGTGTSVGDPVELRALGTVIGAGRSPDRPCVIGSVKTNIGHTEGAAGVAGLVKVALALKHRAIPPSLHLEEPNPTIPWDSLPFVVSRALTPWPSTPRPALAGVSAFGISGTNAHVVVAEAPDAAGPRAEASPPSEPEARLLTLSAQSPEALQDAARAHRAFLEGERDDASDLRDICYTASVRRTHHDHRLAVVACSRAELAERLDAFLQGEARPGMSSGRRIPDLRRRLVFVFPGQGSQWVGMARDLSEREPAFAEALERCHQAFRPYADWSLREELAADESRSRLGELDVVQPTLFAIQVALASLWRSWGIEPDAVVGHSMGEVAAAHVAGALGLDDAARIICRRSQIVRRGASGKGGMAVLELPVDDVRDLLARHGDRLAVAACNSPTTTVVSGDPAALRDLGELAEARGVFFQAVKVDYASHSPQMDDLRPLLLEALGEITGRPASVPIVSTVSASPVDGTRLDAAYWMANLREPVLFAQVVDRLVDDGHDLFLEISAHPVLTAAVGQTLRRRRRHGAVLPSLRRGEDARSVMLGSVGALYAEGYPVDWKRLHAGHGRVVRLPPYPWQRERFWLDVPAGEPDDRALASRGAGRRRFLDRAVTPALLPGTHVWELLLGVRAFPFLRDHRVQDLVVLPATAYVEMALEAASEVLGPGPHAVEKLSLQRALFLSDDGPTPVQFVSSSLAGEVSFQVLTRAGGDAASPDTGWTPQATGTIRALDVSLSSPGTDSVEEVQARCPEVVSGPEHYEGMARRGIQYGPAFQGVEQVWRRDGEAIGRIRLPEAARSGRSDYRAHPALLDACAQVMESALPRSATPHTYLPVFIDSLRVYDRLPLDAPLWSHVRLEPGAEPSANRLQGDLSVLDEHGRILVAATGLVAQRLEPAREAGPEDCLYEVRWQQAEPSRPPARGATAPGRPGRWLIFGDRARVGERLARVLVAGGEVCSVVSPGDDYSMPGAGRYRLDPARPEHFRRLFDEALGDDMPLRGVLYLWSLDVPAPDDTPPASSEPAAAIGCTGILHLVQALAERRQTPSPRLWLVTRGAQAVEPGAGGVAVAQAPVSGLGRVVSVEHPELRCRVLDLGSREEPDEIRALVDELSSEDPEDQVALRGAARYVPRLTRVSPRALESLRREIPGDAPFRLEIPRPGILDNLVLRATERRPPDPGEVEIRVSAAGLIFRDVMCAMGLLPPVFEGRYQLGWECAGRVVAVGAGVQRFRPGDEVVALGPHCLGSYMTTSEGYVQPKPRSLTFEEAATIPTAFITASYALDHLARLARGERVLIHAAAGGVGQAAVQLARLAGAEIFATAGSEEKREFLRRQGIPHVMDSRSLDFADEVLRRTGGRGVDVVLNSLAGEFIAKSLSVLAPFGRFVEIGKIDVLRNSALGLRQLEKNQAFFVVDLSQLFTAPSPRWTSLFGELFGSFERGELHPLPHRVFSISDAPAAFHHMAQARHIGKVVVSLQAERVLAAPGPFRFREDATYLVTGGLGGLGLAVAQWLVHRGARHLVLLGRSGASSEAARDALRAMQAEGAEVLVAQADVARRADLIAVLQQIRASMPPLSGVVHAAAVLDDGILLQQTVARFGAVMAPKVDGAWNLHALTADLSLDFFVLFSSAASVIGSPGQGNYVAANAFLDALAHHRRALGLPALSINWGAWAEVGLAARSDRAAHLTGRGVIPFTPAHGLELLGRILELDSPQVMAASMDWARVLGAFSPPLLAELAAEVARFPGSCPSVRAGAGSVGETLRAAPPEERRQMTEAFLVEQIARVLRCSPAKVDVHQPLTKLGVDSLMAVELKNRVEGELGLTLPVAALLRGPSLAQLATHLVDDLAAAPSASPSPPEASDAAGGLLARVPHLSDAEVDLLLQDLLEDEGRESGPQAEARGDDGP